LGVDSTAAHDLAHDRIKGQPVSVFDVLLARQPALDQLQELAIEPVCRVLSSAVVRQHARRKIRKPERVIQFTHHKQTTIRTELRAATFQPHPTVEINPITPLGT
jgi:hypothetical protein